MAAAIVRLADAVTDAVNGGTFSVAFTAVRSWLPVFRLEQGDLATVQVTVAPMTRESAPAARGKDLHRHSIEIAIQKELASETTLETDVDALTDLVEEIADHLTRRALSADGMTWHCDGVKIDPVCAFTELDGSRLFASVIEATYQEWRVSQ